jgi:hypothetical protein
MLALLGFARPRSAARYALPGSASVLGVMSKPMLVSTPVVPLLIDLWRLGLRIAPPSGGADRSAARSCTPASQGCVSVRTRKPWV